MMEISWASFVIIFWDKNKTINLVFLSWQRDLAMIYILMNWMMPLSLQIQPHKQNNNTTHHKLKSYFNCSKTLANKTLVENLIITYIICFSISVILNSFFLSSCLVPMK